MSRITRLISVVSVALLTLAVTSSCATEPVAPPEVVAPTIVSIVPSSVFPGTINDVVVMGTGFVAGSTNLMLGEDISVSNVLVFDATTLTAQVSVSGGAAVGLRGARVSVAGALSATIPFMVQQRPATVVTSISPTATPRDLWTKLTVRGSGFVADSTSIAVSGDAIVIDSLVIVSDSVAEVAVYVDGTAALGVRNLTARTYGLTSVAVPLTVTLTPVATFTVISAGPASDTINALAFPLVVELRDVLGRVAPNSPFKLQFGTTFTEPFIRVGPAGATLATTSNYFEASYQTTTGVDGRATVAARRGSRAGTHFLNLSVPGTPSVVDSIQFVVTAGAAHSVAFDRQGLAMLLGDSVLPTLSVRDRRLNIREDVATLEAPIGASASIVASGHLRGETVGNASVVGAFGGLKDTLQLAVVPRWRLLVRRVAQFGGDTSALMLVDADLSHPRVVVGSPTGPSQLYGGAFNAATARIFFHAGFFDNELLYVSDTVGAFSQLVATALPMIAQYWPQPTTDGQTVWFFGRPGHQNFEVWRVQSNGTGATRVTPLSGPDDEDYHPTPSPDGTKVAHWSSRHGDSLVVLDLASDSVIAIGPRLARIPRWSPLGTWIVVVDEGRLLAIRPDGSETKELTPYNSYSGPVGIGPAEEWVIVRGPERLELINIATQERVLLYGSELLFDPAFVKTAP